MKSARRVAEWVGRIVRLGPLVALGLFAAGQPSAHAQDPGFDASLAYATDAPADVQYFYGDLSPSGTWLDLAGYGWCWQPAEAAADTVWQPYCDGGHWVYTDAGWFWDSDYDWGWAPFHYGRWHHDDRIGWVWFPDRVWGPAWVTWRLAGDSCGWAPLPLHADYDSGGFIFNGVRVGANFDFGIPVNFFAFIPLAHFNDHALRPVLLGQGDVARIYGRSSVINDYRVANGGVFNRGIPVERVTAITHVNLRPLPIRAAPPGARSAHGSAVAVYRRDVQAPTRPVQMRAQQVDERHPVVQQRNFAPTPPATVQRRPEPGLNPEPTRTPEFTPVAQPERPVQVSHQSSASVPIMTPPTPSHGRTALAPHGAIGPEPEPWVANPEDLKPKSPPAKPTPAPEAPFTPHPHTYYQAQEAHALPPATPKPAITPAEATGPNTVPHTYTPRIQQATTAHVLPPELPAGRSIKPATPPGPIANPKTAPASGSGSGSGGDNKNQHPNH